jgi:hypothetical protein
MENYSEAEAAYMSALSSNPGWITASEKLENLREKISGNTSQQLQ